jgi:hypothetical protein
MAYLGNYGGTFQSDIASLTRLATSGDFSAYLQQEIFEQSLMIRSGILMQTNQLLVSTTGTRVEAPFFRPIDPVEERMTSGNNWGTSAAGYFTPQKITGSTQYATITHRGFAYAADKLTELATGEDPLRAIAAQLTPALNKLKTKKAISQLEGLLGTGGVLNATQNLNKSVTTGAGEANYLRAGAIVEARYKLGARQGDITTIFIPPAVAASLEVLGFLAYDGDRAGVNRRQSIGIFGDLQVIVDDQLPILGTTGQQRQFVCYLCGPGVLLEGEQTPLEIEMGRNALSKQDVMVVDYHHAQHVAGTSWSSATDNPTNTQLATPANYALAYTEPRLIPLVRLVVNSEYGGLVQ